MGHFQGFSHDRYLDDLDRYFSGDPAEFVPLMDAALDALSSDRSLLDLATEQVDATAADHFGNHWLGEWWPEHQPVEPLLRQGLIEALTRSREAGIPLQTVIAEGPAERFEIGVMESASQVTMVILAPSPGDDSFGGQGGGVTIVRRVSGNIEVG